MVAAAVNEQVEMQLSLHVIHPRSGTRAPLPRRRRRETRAHPEVPQGLLTNIETIAHGGPMVRALRNRAVRMHLTSKQMR